MKQASIMFRNGLILGAFVIVLAVIAGCPGDGGGGGVCTSNADCPDDGVFCNGAESCETITGRCVRSGDPCPADETCDEGSETCIRAGATLATPSRSTTIALTSDDRRLVVVNRETDSVSVIEVRDEHHGDAETKLAEISVGNEPRFVSLHPNDREAYVANAVDGTVSVISLSGDTEFTVVDEIAVGTEPRGCAITPNGTRLYVANHTEGTVTAIDLESRTILGTVNVGGQPAALAISNDGDDDDTDERVFVTQFYAEMIPGGPGEVSDVGKQGVVQSFSIGNPGSPVRLTLSPLENIGFTADRTNFCGTFNAMAVNDVFCPDVNEADPASPTITAVPQGAFPNQLTSALIRGNRLFLPNIGAGPEPPVRFNVNVQALVHVANTGSLEEEENLHVNLNDQIKAETQPDDPAGSLVRLFGGDLIGIDADQDGENFLIVSRGGNYVMRATLDADGRLDIGAPDVVRFQTGNLPNGVVISADGNRAYVNNEAGISVTAINLSTNVVITRDIPSSTPPAPGTSEHEALLGKVAFFTSLGIPDIDILGTPIRDIIPVNDRNKASDNGWEQLRMALIPDGLADGVTWSFGTGPRQSVPLDSFFAKGNPSDQRISNYSAVMGSVTDFNNNSRGVQGGIGFANDPPDPRIFAHGITEGASEALDAMTVWVQTVRTLNMPNPTDTAALSRGGMLFDTNCASCHGGAKWTKSEIIYDNNPTFTADVTAGGMIIDTRVTNAGPQIVSFTENGEVLQFLENVGTFNPLNDFELRGAGAQSGQPSLGALGFNVPSLLGIGAQAPYFHDGSAQSLDDVFDRHGLGVTTIAGELSSTEQADLIVFLNAIDGSTIPLASETDDFR